MKIQKLCVLAALTFATTGCSMLFEKEFALLPEPYEVRYFSKSACERMREPIVTDKSLKITLYKYDKTRCATSIPYEVIAKDTEGNHVYFRLKDIPEKIVRKDSLAGTLTPEQYKKRKDEEERRKAETERLRAEAERKKAEEKRKKAEAERKKAEAIKANEAKKQAELEQATKKYNDKILSKYGKPYCSPAKVVEIYDDGSYGVTGGGYAGRMKDCLFEKKFYIDSVLSDGMIAYDRKAECVWGSCFDNGGGPYYIIKNENDAEKIDGDYVSGFFEYVGVHNSLGGTMLKFKHVK